MSPPWLRTSKPYLIERSEELFSVKVTGAGRYFKSRYWNILTKPRGHIATVASLHVPTLIKVPKTLLHRPIEEHFSVKVSGACQYFKLRYWHILTKPQHCPAVGKKSVRCRYAVFFSKYLGIGTVSVVLNTEKYRQNTAKIPHWKVPPKYCTEKYC